MRCRCLLLALVAAACGHADILPERYLADVRHLSSPAMQGRGTGEPRLDRAADYLEAELKRAGIPPVPGLGGYRQFFSVLTHARLGSGNRLAVLDGSARQELSLRSQFQPLPFSGVGRVSGPLVFAGYGITAPECGYDDYAGLDVRGKLVVVLRHEPQEFDDDSVFAGRSYTEHAQLPRKAQNARLHGALGVLFVNDSVSHTGAERLPPFEPHPGPDDAGLPFVGVEADVVSGWIALAGKDLKTVLETVDRTLRPPSFPFPDRLRVELQVDVRRDTRRVANVLGYLPGLTTEYVVLGAHYDHLGHGAQYSLSPADVGAIHPGADDNASGTAGVLEVARHLAAAPRLRRGVLFVLFAGEELGLLGSGYFASEPPLPLADAVAMINLDMIGRPVAGRVHVGGAASGTLLGEAVETSALGTGLTMDLSERAGYGASDHSSFLTRQVPALFFFTGLHADYHRPSDTWDKIDAQGAARVVAVVARVTEQLAAGDRPRFRPPTRRLPDSGVSADSGNAIPFRGR